MFQVGNRLDVASWSLVASVSILLRFARRNYYITKWFSLVQVVRGKISIQPFCISVLHAFDSFVVGSDCRLMAILPRRQQAAEIGRDR